MGVDLVLDGPGVRLVLSDDPGVDGEPGLQVEVSNEDTGQAALVLDLDDAREVRDYLDRWITATTAPPGD